MDQSKKEFMNRMQKVEDLLAEAAGLLESLVDDAQESKPGTTGFDILSEAHDNAYGAMCSLANLRVDLEKE